jgi:hypothetical protein
MLVNNSVLVEFTYTVLVLQYKILHYPLEINSRGLNLWQFNNGFSTTISSYVIPLNISLNPASAKR